MSSTSRLFCQHCSRSFMSLAGLNTHQQFVCEHSPSAKQNRAEASIARCACGRSFRRFSSLGQHALFCRGSDPSEGANERVDRDTTPASSVNVGLSSSPLMQNLSELISLKQFHDVVLHCADNQRVFCHSLFFVSASTFLYELLKSLSDRCAEDGFVLIAPDFAAEDVHRLLHLLHTGEASPSSGLSALLTCLRIGLPTTLAGGAIFCQENQPVQGGSLLVGPDVTDRCSDDEEHVDCEESLQENAIDLSEHLLVEDAILPSDPEDGPEDAGEKEEVSPSTAVGTVVNDPKDDILICYWCSLLFAAGKMQKHVSLLHPERMEEFLARVKEEGPIRCEHCDEGQLSSHMLMRHFRIKHDLADFPCERGKKRRKEKKKKITGFKCFKCDVIFTSSDKYGDHMNRVHLLPPGELAYSCDKCEKRTNSARGFKKHLKLHLPQSSLCNNCGQTYPTVFDLRLHEKIHRKDQRRPGNKENKTKDAATEAGREEKRRRRPNKNLERNHVCHICARKFASVTSLNGHVKLVHKPEEELLSCEQCFKKFNNTKSLENHQLLHGDPTRSCPHCTKVFHTDSYLKGHILRAHTPWHELPYSCQLCRKGFTEKAILIGHMNMHEGVTPHQCRYCPKAYQNPSNRMAHEKKSHPQLYTKIRRGVGAVRVKDRVSKIQDGEFDDDEFGIMPREDFRCLEEESNDD